MEQQNSDRDLRSLFERNLPPVDTDEVWSGVRQEIGLRRRAPRPRRARLRVVLTATVAALVVAAVGVGVMEAVTHLGGRETVIVIGGTDAPPTSVSAATTTTAAASATTGQVTTELTQVVQALRDGNIVPLSVEPDPSERNGIIVKVPADKMAPPDGVFYSHRLQRELFLATHRLNLPFDWCDVYSVDARGEETFAFGMNPQAGMAFAEDWSSGVPVDEQRAHYLATMALGAVAKQAGVQEGEGLELGWRAGGSRTLKWVVMLPAEGEKEAYLAFLKEVFSAVVQLNQEGCQLAVLELSINDAEGGPILRDVHDFELQSVATWYSSADFMPLWINPPSAGPTSLSMPPLTAMLTLGYNAPHRMHRRMNSDGTGCYV
jgi:hypothetical protein